MRPLNRVPFLSLNGLIALVVLVLPTPAAASAPIAQDQQGQEASDEDGIRPYEEVITDEAVTSEGLFDTHMIGDELYYEIPIELMEREMLLLTRVAATPAGNGSVDPRWVR